MFQLVSSNGGGMITSDMDGSFLVELSANWSGTVSFVKDGYSFAPSALNLGPLSTDSVGNTIVATRSDILYVNGIANVLAMVRAGQMHTLHLGCPACHDSV